MRRRQRLAALLVIVAAACASSTKHGESTDAPEPEDDSQVVVQNDYLGDIEIFIVTGSIRNRLGRVAVGQTAEFVIPPRYLERPDVQFMVTPSATTTSGFTFQPISMNPGSSVELRINRVLTSSTYQILGR